MERKIYRSTSNRVLFGVCGGIGEYFKVDPTIIRLLFIITAFMAGFGIIAYFICALVIPQGENNTQYYDENHETNYKNGSIIIGFSLIIIGAVLLLRKFCPWFSIKWYRLTKFWPILLIIAGIAILIKQRKNT